MDDLAEIERRNVELAERINQEALSDPSSPYAGKWVGIANGQVVVITQDRGELYHRLRDVEPNHRRCCIIEASRDYSGVWHV